MAHPDCERAKVCSAPGHRRLRDRADADCTADTPSTVLPRSRRDSAGAANPAGSLSSDQTEVLHHCGWSEQPVFGLSLMLILLGIGMSLPSCGLLMAFAFPLMVILAAQGRNGFARLLE